MAKPNVVAKQDLIQSALRCIQENGLDKLTFKAVAQGAGVTQGTVYYHFKTKEQLMFEIVQAMCNDSWQAADRLPPAPDLKGTIIRLLEEARGRCTHGSFYHTLFFSLVVHSLQNPALREQLREMLDRENSNVAALLAQLLPATVVSGIPLPHQAVMINALIDGLALQALVNPDFPAGEVYSELIASVSKRIPDPSAEHS